MEDHVSSLVYAKITPEEFNEKMSSNKESLLKIIQLSQMGVEYLVHTHGGLDTIKQNLTKEIEKNRLIVLNWVTDF